MELNARVDISLCGVYTNLRLSKSMSHLLRTGNRVLGYNRLLCSAFYYCAKLQFSD